MILALDTSTAACTAALLGPDGVILAAADERIGRGHAERLAPMIAELLAGHVPTAILVGIGPGSFTGIRVGIAFAHGLAIGWSVPLSGMDSLGLIAASAGRGPGPVAVAVPGGHGELFVATYDGETLAPLSPPASLVPASAARVVTAQRIVGDGAEALVAERGSGEAHPMLPSASRALSLPERLRTLEPRPAYVRPPDAKPRAAA